MTVRRDNISPNLVSRVNGEIRKFLGQALPAEAFAEDVSESSIFAAELNVTEPLSVWRMKPGSLEKLPHADLSKDVFDWAEPTNSFYHDVILGGEGVGFARSADTEGKVISQLRLSRKAEFAARVNRALKFVESLDNTDEFMSSDPVIRLFEILPAHVTALWLFDEQHHLSKLVVVSAARRYRGLQTNSLLSSKQFLEALKEGGRILGIA